LNPIRGQKGATWLVAPFLQMDLSSYLDVTDETCALRLSVEMDIRGHGHVRGVLISAGLFPVQPLSHDRRFRFGPAYQKTDGMFCVSRTNLFLLALDDRGVSAHACPVWVGDSHQIEARDDQGERDPGVPGRAHPFRIGTFPNNGLEHLLGGFGLDNFQAGSRLSTLMYVPIQHGLDRIHGHDGDVFRGVGGFIATLRVIFAACWVRVWPDAHTLE
jgi:hypothetical protein